MYSCWPNNFVSGSNQNHSLSGSKKSQQFGREAIKQFASTTPSSQNHTAKIISPGPVSGGIKVKSIYSNPQHQPNQQQVSPSSQHHHQAQSIQQSSPRGMGVQQQTSPRGFISQQSSSPMMIVNQQTSPRGVVNQQTSPRGLMGNNLQHHQQGGMGMSSGVQHQPATSIYQVSYTNIWYSNGTMSDFLLLLILLVKIWFLKNKIFFSEKV